MESITSDATSPKRAMPSATPFNMGVTKSMKAENALIADVRAVQHEAVIVSVEAVANRERSAGLKRCDA